MARPVIVVGVASSPDPLVVVRAAADMAAALDGELIVVHVVHLPAVVAAESIAAAGAAIAADEDAERTVHLACVEVLGGYRIPWRFEPRRGEVAHELQAVAEENDAACIVIGRHGRHHLIHALSGSPLHPLVDSSLTPVLVVPTPG
jgi:nucleotide-binding universal stress UspA family protein